MSVRKTILLFTDWYEPGFKAGGPIRSCKNIVQHFSGDFIFYIVTSDRDLGDVEPYKNLETDRWVPVSETVNIYYSSPGSLKVKTIRQMISEIRPAAIYLNSLFSFSFTLKPLWALRKSTAGQRVILAPRGMLKDSALGQKRLKKKLFLTLVPFTRLYRNVVFHATDDQEKNEITQHFGGQVNVIVAPNVPGLTATRVQRKKDAGELRVAFLSRIHPIKNLLFALQVFEKLILPRKVVFDIYGSSADHVYYSKCFDVARRLEKRYAIQFIGQVHHHEVNTILTKYHLFFLPTQGENFGHAIFEGLAAGCPVLISDQTPWNGINKTAAGWAVPLDQPQKFSSVLEKMFFMEQEEFDNRSAAAYQVAEKYAARTDLHEAYIRLFITNK